jgi:hypothetical protein
MVSIAFNTRVKQHPRCNLRSSQSKVEVVRRLSDVPMIRLYQQNDSVLSDEGIFSHEPPKELSSTQWEKACEPSYLQQFSPISDETSIMSCHSFSSVSASELTEPTLSFPETIEEENDISPRQCLDGESPPAGPLSKFIKPKCRN